jgi:acyl-CoA dehydrogenase
MPPELPSLRLAAPLPEGVPDEAALLARYCAARGVAPPSSRDWAFYLALSLFRLLAILAGVAARARQGNASSAAAAAISSDAVLGALADAALGIIDRAEAGGGGGGSGGSTGGKARAARPRPTLSAPSARAADLLARVTAFVSAHVLPAEAALTAHATGPERWTIHPLAEELKARAKAAGLWNLWLPADMAAKLGHLLGEVPEGERGTLLGAGLSNLDYAHVCAAMGVSVWAPEVFNCSAPDTGNMEVLARCSGRGGTGGRRRRSGRDGPRALVWRC